MVLETKAIFQGYLNAVGSMGWKLAVTLNKINPQNPARCGSGYGCQINLDLLWKPGCHLGFSSTVLGSSLLQLRTLFPNSQF